MIDPTEEMKAAVKRRMGIPADAELDPWMTAALSDVLAIIKRDYRLVRKPGVARPRRVSRVEHDPVALKWARKQAGWKQSHLAKAVGISVSLMSEAEKSTRGLSRPVLQQIATTLGCPVSLFARKDR